MFSKFSHNAYLVKKLVVIFSLLFQIVDKKTKALPDWLVFDNTTNLLHGIPKTGDIGTYSIRLKAMCIDPSNMECQGKISRTFQIKVVEPIISADSRGRTNFKLHAWSGKHHGKYSLNLTNQAVTPQPSFMFMSSTNLYVHDDDDLHTTESVRLDRLFSAQHYLHDVNRLIHEQSYSSDVNSFIKSPCDPRLPSFYASLLLHVKHELTNANLTDIVLSLSTFISKPLHLISISNSIEDIFSMQMDHKHILTAGPGNVIGSINESMELSWHLACGEVSHLAEFIKVLQHNIDVGRIPRELNIDVLAWYVYSDQPVPRRVRRNANARNRGTRTPAFSLEPSTVSFEVSSLDIDFTEPESTIEMPVTSSFVMNTLSSSVRSPQFLSSNSSVILSEFDFSFSLQFFTSILETSTGYMSVITTVFDNTLIQIASPNLVSGIFTSLVSTKLVTSASYLNSLHNTLSFSSSLSLSSRFSATSSVTTSSGIEVLSASSLSASTEVYDTLSSSVFALQPLSTTHLVSSASRNLGSKTPISLSPTSFSHDSFLQTSSITISSSNTVQLDYTSLTSLFMSNIFNSTFKDTKSFNFSTFESSFTLPSSFPDFSSTSFDDSITVVRTSSHRLPSTYLITSPVSDSLILSSHIQIFSTKSLPSQSLSVARSMPFKGLSSHSILVSGSTLTKSIVSLSTIRTIEHQSSYFIKPTTSYLFSLESSSKPYVNSVITTLFVQSTHTITDISSVSRNSLVSHRSSPLETSISAYLTSLPIESTKTTVSISSTIEQSSDKVVSDFFNVSNTFLSSESAILISQTMLDTDISYFSSTSSVYITSYQTGHSMQKSPSVASTTMLPTVYTTVPEFSAAPSTSATILSFVLTFSTPVISSTSQTLSLPAFSSTKPSETSFTRENSSNVDFETRFSSTRRSTTILKSSSLLFYYSSKSTYSQLELETSFSLPLTISISSYSFASSGALLKASDFRTSSPGKFRTSEATTVQPSIYPSISNEVFSRQQLTTSSQVLMTSSHVVSTGKILTFCVPVT